MPVHGHVKEEQQNTEVVPYKVEELYSEKGPHTPTPNINLDYGFIDEKDDLTPVINPMLDETTMKPLQVDTTTTPLQIDTTKTGKTKKPKKKKGVLSLVKSAFGIGQDTTTPEKNAIQSPPDSPDITNLTMTKGDKPVEQNITQSIPESPDLTNVTMTRGDNTIDKLNTTRISKFGKYEYIAWINHHRKYNDASLNDKDKPELKK